MSQVDMRGKLVNLFGSEECLCKVLGTLKYTTTEKLYQYIHNRTEEDIKNTVSVLKEREKAIARIEKECREKQEKEYKEYLEKLQRHKVENLNIRFLPPNNAPEKEQGFSVAGDKAISNGLEEPNPTDVCLACFLIDDVRIDGPVRKVCDTCVRQIVKESGHPKNYEALQDSFYRCPDKKTCAMCKNESRKIFIVGCCDMHANVPEDYPEYPADEYEEN